MKLENNTMDFTGYFKNTSYACKQTLNSFYQKKLRIKNYAIEIENDLERINSTISKVKEDLIIKNRLLENFTSYCECVYSCMDYIGYLLYIYQRRTKMLIGSLKGTDSSFNGMINSYCDENKKGKYPIFKNREFCNTIDNIQEWYPIIRSIRSKETHYNTGIITLDNYKVIYNNHVEYGEHVINSFDLSLVMLFYASFSKDTEELIKLMTEYHI